MSIGMFSSLANMEQASQNFETASTRVASYFPENLAAQRSMFGASRPAFLGPLMQDTFTPSNAQNLARFAPHDSFLLRMIQLMQARFQLMANTAIFKSMVQMYKESLDILKF